jgi:hypothetical protein
MCEVELARSEKHVLTRAIFRRRSRAKNLELPVGEEEKGASEKRKKKLRRANAFIIHEKGLIISLDSLAR